MTNWAEFRAAQGLQVSHVDLTYTGKMFANMQPVEFSNNNGLFLAVIGGTNTQAVDEMNWNFERYGDFLGKALTEEDKKTLQETVALEIISVLEQFKI